MSLFHLAQIVAAAVDGRHAVADDPDAPPRPFITDVWNDDDLDAAIEAAERERLATA